MTILSVFGVILLTYTIVAHIISVVSPVPLIGFGIALLGFPLALKLSFKELFFVEFFGVVFGVVIKFDKILSYFNVFTSIQIPFYQSYLVIGFVGGILFAIIGSPLVSAFFMKLLSRRLTPKRIKMLLNEK